MYLHWHRRDLRLVDNAGLAAGAPEPTLPVFVFDEAVLDHAAPARVAFLLDALSALRDAYRDRGGDLLLARGDPTAVLPRLASAHGASTVTWGRDYSGLARERDRAVRAALGDAEIAAEAVHDGVVHPPGSITTSDGDHYSVFTYFGRKWHDRAADAPHSPIAAERVECPPTPGELPSVTALGFEPPTAAVPAGTRQAGRDRLEDFCAGPIYAYADARDVPAADGTSRLSPHLKFGTVGIREVYAATEDAKADAPDSAAAESVETFQDQLTWRDFYTQVLAANPETVTEDFRSYDSPIEWADDPDGLAAWKAGETGYPIVDAGMRQLRAEAWLHNRLRMIVAAFLTKDLRIDWRAGYAWFRERLVDHDTANDVGGWQWAASTGTDAQPYFRIFNPMTQGERHDPEATYIKRYVPELDDVPADVIHDWDDLDPESRTDHAPDYPAPIVDHGAAREAALAMFEAARGEAEQASGE